MQTPGMKTVGVLVLLPLLLEWDTTDVSNTMSDNVFSVLLKDTSTVHRLLAAVKGLTRDILIA